jgi:predicted nucleic acid-binding protein
LWIPISGYTRARTQRYQLRYYDAAIVAAALELGASQLVSEDFSARQAFGRLAVVNPFGAVMD